jgi:hypothetical protein
MESTTGVQEQVKEKYGSAARAVAQSGSVQACCDPGLRCCDPITTNLYSADQTGIIPEKGGPGLSRVRQPNRADRSSTWRNRSRSWLGWRHRRAALGESASVQPAKHTALT